MGEQSHAKILEHVDDLRPSYNTERGFNGVNVAGLVD